MCVVRVRAALLLIAIVANAKGRGKAFIITMLSAICGCSYHLSYIRINIIIVHGIEYICIHIYIFYFNQIKFFYTHMHAG